MDKAKTRIGIVVVLLAMVNSFVVAGVSGYNGVDPDGYADRASYKALIKKNGKLVNQNNTVPTMYDNYGYYSVSSPILAIDDLYSGGISDRSNGFVIFQKVVANANYTKAKAAKSGIYSYSVTNLAGVRASYGIDRSDFADLTPGVNTNLARSKAYIKADASKVLADVYLAVQKSDQEQGGLLAKYVVYMNRVISHMSSGGSVPKEYAKRLVSGVLCVYSTSKGQVYIKTSGGIDKSGLEVSLVDRLTGEEVTSFTGLTKANNNLLKAETDDLADFYLKISDVSLTKSFWYTPKDSEALFVDIFAESTVYAKQLDAVALSNQAPAMMPEPATMAFLALGGLFASRRKR